MDLNVDFQETEVFFDPLAVALPQGVSQSIRHDNVLKVDRAAVRRKEIENLL